MAVLSLAKRPWQKISVSVGNSSPCRPSQGVFQIFKERASHGDEARHHDTASGIVTSQCVCVRNLFMAMAVGTWYVIFNT